MIMRTHLHQTSSHHIMCLQVCPSLNKQIHHGGLTIPGNHMEGCVTILMKYKHKQTCRVREAQRPVHINIWCNDHAYTSTSDVISPHHGPPNMPRPESGAPPRQSHHPRQRGGGMCDHTYEI